MAASFLGGDTLIFAIDPGSEKTGTAVVADDGSLVTKAIVPTPELGDYLSHIYENYPFSHIVMGDGTNHKKLQPLVEQWIARNHGDITFSLTDEKFTTVEGRKLYFKYTPRKAGAVSCHCPSNIRQNRSMTSSPGSSATVI